MSADFSLALAWSYAAQVIAELAERGVRVVSVRVGRAIRIEIERPDPRTWIRGALCRRIKGRRELVSRFRGCELRWAEVAEPSLADDDELPSFVGLDLVRTLKRLTNPCHYPFAEVENDRPNPKRERT